jgi:hypothetical protein
MTTFGGLDPFGAEKPLISFQILLPRPIFFHTEASFLIKPLLCSRKFFARELYAGSPAFLPSPQTSFHHGTRLPRQSKNPPLSSTPSWFMTASRLFAA